MTVLIELFDREESVNNVLSLTALRPDHLVVLGDSQVRKQKAQRPLMKYLESIGLAAETEFIPCRTYDIADILEQLSDVIGRYGAESCVIDLLGGSDTMLMAVGCCCREMPQLRVITQRAKTNKLVWLWGPDKGDEITVDFRADIGQMISLAGGELVRNGHVDGDDVGDDFEQLIPRVFRVYMRNRSGWAGFVQYLQQLNQPPYQHQDGKSLSGPMEFRLGRREVEVDLSIVLALQKAGAITGFSLSGGSCTITFCSAQLLRCLCDVGAWLELFVYSTLRRSGLFRSVEISAVISWDDDGDNRDVINEIDVIALDGLGQMFISCKTNVPDNMVLNEIATLTERFGTEYAVPVLATACQLDKEAPGVYRRAAEMGVVIIDADDLMDEDGDALGEKLLRRVSTLRRKWNIGE